MTFKIDRSEVSAVALCRERGCGWRGLAVSYAQALRRVAHHEESLHPGVFHARDQLRKATEVSTGPRPIPRQGARSSHGNQAGAPARK